MRFSSISHVLLVVCGTVAVLVPAGVTWAKIQAGDHYSVDIAAPSGYAGARGVPALEWRYELHHEGATYIALHIANFDLPPGDVLLVTDAKGEQAYTMAGRGKMQAGTFWARHIKGDTAVLHLIKSNADGGGELAIDEYVAGYLDLDGPRAICGIDDKENSICYETSHPDEYDRGRAVARLLSGGSGFCTGWLVSAQNHLITNQHCLETASDPVNTDYDFMAEAPTCSTPNCPDCFPGTIVSGASSVQYSYNLDYHLVQLNSSTAASEFGFLEIDDREAIIGEEIYIIGHPDGRAKEHSIFSTYSGDPGNIPIVHSITEPACQGSGYNDVGYFADTEGGSSGSPVLARSSHKVIALHHCANCPNRGVPIHLVNDEIEAYLYPGPQGALTLDRELYGCNDTLSIELRDGDIGASGTYDVAVTTGGGDAETVTLVETGADTAIFVGNVVTDDSAVVVGDGVLQVVDGQAVTVTYTDADDGQGGQNVPVTALATIDCVPPMITNVQTTDVQPRSAVVTISSNELVRGTVHYGLSCGSLTGSASTSSLANPTVVSLPSLQDDVTYFYAAEVRDEAGNLATDDNGGACYTFTTPEVPDFFTEVFPEGGTENDLDNRTLFFEPNGSVDFYGGCVEEITSLPTDPTGGTTLSLGDDEAVPVAITGGQSVLLYGTAYTTIYVCSNGYVTLGQTDDDYNETPEEHFAIPRVAAVYDDFNPSSSGSVSYRQLADRMAVTWQNVPEYNTSNSNTFQIELFFDGLIAVSYLDVAAGDGIAGLSSGDGLSPVFYETDLTALGACGPKPPLAHAGQAGTAVSVPVLITLAADDDGLPDPPAELTYIVASLPDHGVLHDPNDGAVLSVPYVLVANGKQVIYDPDAGYEGPDSLTFQANDGGVAPDGGDSNEAMISITVGGPAWTPVAHSVSTTTQTNVPVEVALSGSDPNGDPLTYTIESLPAQGYLSDPDVPGAAIETAPYELPNRFVNYHPPCGLLVQESFTFTVSDATATSSEATATVTVNANDPRRVFDFTFDTDPGWNTEGDWEYGPATAGGSHNGDPGSAHTGTNVYGYNLGGDYPNFLPVRYLTSGALDCSRMTNVELRFWRWLGVESYPGYDVDHATVEVSSDGSSYDVLWENTGDSVDDDSWVEMVLDLSAYADSRETVYLRWGMGPTDNGVTYPGWNLDDVEIWGIVATAAADFNVDAFVNLDDAVFFADCLNGPGEALSLPCRCVDLDGDGDVDLGDLAEFQTAFTE